MASAISRNHRLRYIYCSFSSNYSLLNRCHSTSSSRSPLLQLYNNSGLENLHHRSQLLSSSDFGRVQYGMFPSWTSKHRFLCTTTTNVNKSSNSAGPSDASSDAGKSKTSSGGSQKTTKQGKPIRGSPVSWMSFFLLLATGAVLVWYYDREKKRHIEGINSASKTVKEGPSAGKAAIGGPFNLVDHTGKSVTEKNFFGNWNLIYFGFTHCPDICPDELQKLAAAVDKIKEKSGIQVVPVFISVDPERDTVEQVREYVKEFHPNLIGLTGNADEIKKAARAYRVYYMKTEEEGSDYLVDHSIVIYLMDPKMEFVKFFGKNTDADLLAEGVINEIKQRKKVGA
ncbi:unnamed protein product [Coffea canephora]|uniref:Thioredoxin domain-containing protein n=1 Tax=Coffea canephora TaxID=49390 RepID=A0A068UTH7_COFCA|nr:unnamed protein product [Coffea canephora]